VPHRIIASAADVEALTTLLGTLKQPFTVEWRQGRDRSLDQNELMWLWATEASRQRGDVTSDEVQQEWKLIYGVPILREEEASFREVYDEALKGQPYPVKLKAMRFLPITSIMSVKQMTKFLDTVQRECAQQGIRLTDPDPMRKAA
jgi:hypothetical protein